MLLDDVAIPAPVLLLQYIPGFAQVCDDRISAAFGDAERFGDVAQSHAGIVRNAQECLPMVREEAPLHHRVDTS